MWNAVHLVTTIEHYEQCINLNVSSGGDADSSASAATVKKTNDVPAAAVAPIPAASVAPAVPVTPATPAASSGESCNDGKFKCNGNKIGQCVNKSFVWFTSAPDTQCRDPGSFIYCD